MKYSQLNRIERGIEYQPLFSCSSEIDFDSIILRIVFLNLKE
jgi:hypothetical protein